MSAGRDVRLRQGAAQLVGQRQEFGRAVLEDDRQAHQPRSGELGLLHDGIHFVGGAESGQLDRVAVLAQHGRQIAGAQVFQFFCADEQHVCHACLR